MAAFYSIGAEARIGVVEGLVCVIYFQKTYIPDDTSKVVLKRQSFEAVQCMMFFENKSSLKTPI